MYVVLGAAISGEKNKGQSKEQSVAETIIKGAEGEGSSEKSLEKRRKRLLLWRKIQLLPNTLLYI